MKRFVLAAIILLSVCSPALAQEKTLLIDDFSGSINGGPNGTLDFGAGAGSSLEVSADTQIKYPQDGQQSIKAVYNAVPGGYIWIARGFGLDAKNAQWPVRPEDIDWKKYRAISFYLYGSASGAKVAFDIKDNGGELWRFIGKDTVKGWVRIVCPFAEFNPRQDWQPDTAVANGQMDFPIESFQFEPMESDGTLYFDRVELIERG